MREAIEVAFGYELVEQQGLHVFALDHSEWVIARDEEDATVVWCEQMGEKAEDYPEQDWVQLDDRKLLKMWCEPGGDVGPIEGDGCTLVEKLAIEWIAELGRGYMGGLDA